MMEEANFCSERRSRRWCSRLCCLSPDVARSLVCFGSFLVAVRGFDAEVLEAAVAEESGAVVGAERGREGGLIDVVVG